MTTATNDSAGSATPWHLWVVGLIAVLWNGFAGYDYIMTNTEGDAYLRRMGMTEAQIAYMDQYPAWMTAVWAVGVWGAVLGAVLLLVRSRWAFPSFAASLIAFVISLVYAYGMSNGAEVMGRQMMIMNVVILAGCLFFAWYSRLMTKRGVLR